jgi:hypothetical protein
MQSPTTSLKKADLLWILAYPLYQIIGTIRHEASHALMAWLEGSTVNKFVFWPTVNQSGRFLWGYVELSGPTTWLTSAAPYFVDPLTFGLFFWMCLRLRFPRRWVWLNAVIIGLLSPLFNSGYNYWRSPVAVSDVGRLLLSLPPFMVHAYLVLTMALYVVGLYIVFRRGPR